MIFFCLVPSTFCLLAPARAQINPDNTLGVENSRVTPNTLINGLPSDQIDGGAQRGSNLFHSFTQFNVNDGQRVFFANPLDVKNIFTRVTGGQVSNILGTLGVDGNANLFLMNPNGIVFGKNASLNVNGSFVATTANGIQFGNLGTFSATNPEAPSSLLTINPRALLFNQINPTASIQNNSIAPAVKDPTGTDTIGLRVPDGKSLLLVGGNVSMDGGKLKAYGGRVELGGLATSGNVNILFDGDNLRLGFPENVTRADVLLTNQAAINVEGSGGGNIAINARNLEILQESTLLAGIARGLGTPETVAGDITLNTTGEIKVAGRSSIANNVLSGAKGSGGNITIESGSVSLRDRTQLEASTYGQGNAGNVTVQAKDAVSLVEGDIFSTVDAGGVGNGGKIDINAASLSLQDGAQLATITRGESNSQPAGRGDAGNVNVKVTGNVDITGQKNDFLSGIFSSVSTGSVGNAGNITIDTGSFSLRDSARLSASTNGQGNAGNVTVRAVDVVSLAGNALIRSTVEASGVGKGGNIDINAASLSLTDGARLLTSTRGAFNTLLAGRGDAGNVNVKVTGNVDIAGQKNGFVSGLYSSADTGTVGNGGNITVNTGSFSLRDGARLSASTSGQGKAGNVTVGAVDAVSLTGNALIRSTVQAEGVGNGGNITIDTGSFSLRNGARLEASTFGQGNAGNVTLRAKGAVSLVEGDILSTVEAGGMGKGGNIDINATSLSLIDGAQLATLTRGASNTQPAGRGDAGDVNVKVTGNVDIAGKKNGSVSGILTQVNTEAFGNGGNITIDTGSFSLRDGAQLETSTYGQGNAGNVTVGAKDAVSLVDGSILSTVDAGGVGNGGKIEINAASLSLTDGAQLATITRGESNSQPAGKGDAGDVNVKVTGNVDIAGQKNGFVSGILSSFNTDALGNGGNITVDTGSFSLRDGARLEASTSGQGNAGNITVRAVDAVSLAGNAGIRSTVEAEGVGNGGNITIDTGSFSLRDDAELVASTFGQGNAGNVTVRAKEAVSLVEGDIFSTVESGGVGNGGNIDINAASLSLFDRAQLATITRGASNTQPAGRGDAGDVNVKVTGNVDIAGQKNGFVSGLYSSVATRTVGNGGNITIDTGSFSLRDGARLSASTSGQGNAGNVTLRAKGAVSLTGNALIRSTVQAEGVGNGGNITIDSGSFSLRNGARLEASTFGQGNAGNVTVQAKGAVSLVEGDILSTVEAGGMGKGGNIDINAASFSLVDGAQLATLTRGASNTQPPGRGDAGDINVKVTGNVDIAGKKNGSVSGILTQVNTEAFGNGGNITIDTGSFSLRNGARLVTSTFGQGNAGNVTVQSKSAASLVNAVIFSAVDAGGVGKGGNIDINAASLSLIDGAQLGTITRGASNTQPAGRGDAGNVNVKVSGNVDIASNIKNGFFSGILSFVDTGTVGNGGNITINSGSFSLRDDALLSASTSGQGNAGNVAVWANIFEVLNGGQLITTTSSNGRAGKITVNATENVIISGRDPNYNNRQTQLSDRVFNASTNSGFFVSSSGSGITGDIEINSPNITLNNQARLNAESTSGNGGNINLNSNLLLLRRGAQITTNAGTAQQGGNGGNININSKFIVAVPQENSDITANAFQGRGGNINVTAQGIFGIEARPKPSEQTNDITASSDLGLSGNINLNSPDNSSLQNNLSQLSQNLVDSNALIASSCIVRSHQKQQNSFTITGTGGLPNRPGDLLVSNYPTGSVRNVTYSNQSSSINAGIWKKGDPIIEPQGVYRTTSGQIVLSRECW